MTAAERQRRRRARLKGLLPAWTPKPRKRPPAFDPDSPLMRGLADLDDLGLREFDVVRPWAHSPSKIPAKS
jgi:hypothetical protein